MAGVASLLVQLYAVGGEIGRLVGLADFAGCFQVDVIAAAADVVGGAGANRRRSSRVDEPVEAVVPAIAAPAATLAQHVRAQPKVGALDREMRCLAGAIYFEARGESLDGQLAVGRVIVERARSGRFPNSYCGVVFQRSQFSFVRGNSMPSIREGSNAWRKAVAVAQIAHSGSWQSPAEGALFFHATRVSPGWRLTRVARVDNHVDRFAEAVEECEGVCLLALSLADRAPVRGDVLEVVGPVVIPDLDELVDVGAWSGHGPHASTGAASLLSRRCRRPCR